MKKRIRIAIIVFASAVFLFYAYKLVSYVAFSEMNKQENDNLVVEAVTFNEDFWDTEDMSEFESEYDEYLPDESLKSDTSGISGSSGTSGNSGNSRTSGSSSPSDPSGTGSDSSDSGSKVTISGRPRKVSGSDTPISVDFDVLWEKNEDVIGWLYQKDTQINYPIMQSTDNAYYLRRSFDRKYNVYGCLYLDYRCAADFTDNTGMIYGHEAQNGSMFGSLAGYKKQEYYDTHKFMYLLTPEANYRVRIFAGCIVRTDSKFYKLPVDDDKLAGRIHEAIENSTFKADIDEEKIGSVLILSTCTYEFANARYLVFGSLEKMNVK